MPPTRSLTSSVIALTCYNTKIFLPCFQPEIPVKGYEKGLYQFAVMLPIAIVYTPRSESEKDLSRMINHLTRILTDIDNVKVDCVELNTNKIVDFSCYRTVVVCGYDHVTLAHLHFALESTDPTTTRIILYDEPGASIERELNTLLVAGSDRGRVPASSTTRLTHSWSHRDIVATIRQDLLQYSDGPEPARQPASPEPAKPRPGRSSRGPRARKVDGKGEAPAREGNGDDGGERASRESDDQ